MTGAERVAVAIPPPRVLRHRAAQTVDGDLIPPLFRCCFTPLDTFVHGPLEFVVRVAKYAGGAAGRVSETPALFPWRIKPFIEVKARGGE